MSIDREERWRQASLGDELTFQRGFDITKKQQRPGAYAVISSSGPRSFHDVFKISGPGVVIGRKGTLGTVFFSKEDFWPHDTTLWVKDFHGNDEKFAYYFLQTMHLEQYDCGASNPTINRNHIHVLPILYPSLPTQRKIAAILSAYDDLIENNTRRIAILEEVAQNLYRGWFVHFRFPGHESVPLVESDLGPIPEKWHVESMSRIAKITRNGVNPTEHPDELFAHYSFPAFDTNSRPLLERGESIRSGKYLIGEDSVLLSKLNPHIPRVWLPFPDPGYRPIASTEFLVLSARRPATRWYLYSLCSGPSFLRAFAALVLGTSTSHQRVKPQDFLDMEVVVPSASIIERFSRLVEPIHLAVHSLRLRNDTLRHTRDLLLPRLISGELDVSDLSIVMPVEDS